MTKREYCENNPVCAVYSMGLCGLEIHGIEYGIEDYIIYAYVGTDTIYSYHKSKIYYGENDSYFVWCGRRIHLSDCMKTNI